MHSLNNKFLKIFIFLFVLLFCFSACSVKAEQKSLTSQFDTIDALITQGQIKDALKLLKKSEKKVYDSWSYIGVYKRYIKLGETPSAEKILKKGLKKNGSNQELNAVYGSFLLNQNRLADAEKITEKLQGTKYASLYSEYVLKKSLEQNFDSQEAQKDFFRQDSFYNVYYDAYLGSKNPMWLRNCAIFNLAGGLFSNAAALCPLVYTDVDDAYFWSLVLYDGGYYSNSIEAIDSSLKFLNDYADKGFNRASLVKLLALQSDAYMAVSDIDSAELARQKIIINIDNLNAKTGDEKLLPAIFVNSAIYALDHDNDDHGADLLFYVVNNYKDYVPGLILYADFAYNSSLERDEDSEILALRKAGLQTLEMKKYDNRRKIPLSDALYRIDESISRTKDPYLYIEKLDLTYKTNKNLSEKDKLRDMWNLLEDTYSEDEKYKTLLVQYAITYLLNTKQDEDAYNLFVRYITEHQDMDAKRDFWDQLAQNVSRTDLGIAEIGALLALKNNRINEAVRIYEYIVFESSGIHEDGDISLYATTSACMNLGDIYFSYGRKEKALDLYGKAAGREGRSRLRSEIYYRIANIYTAYGDIKNALRSVDYAVSIYPENARASLLKDKLKSIQ